ncbi:MAG TPA: response regulator [Vitreimonas sp.]|nr:response regulator [Vitreimonas sp.]
MTAAPKHIFICEDDEGIIEVTKTILEEKGYIVETCSSCTQIFEKLEKVKPDLLLIDLWMPQIGGAEITKKLKADPKTKKIPVIILSANKDTENVAKSVGADDFIQKPFDIDVLEEKVEKFVS